MTRLAIIAVTGYVTGLVIGTGICHIGWCLASKEHRYALTARAR